MFSPILRLDHLSIDKQDAGEAQGSIVVSTAFTVDDCWADPGRDFSTSMILERLAGLSAPAGLLLLDNLEELWAWLWTGDCDCGIEVDASCGVLSDVSSDSFHHWLRQIVDIVGVMMNRDLGRSIIVPICTHD